MKLKNFLNSINYDKTPLLDEDQKLEKTYQPYLVNRAMSFFPDTIFHANEMNYNWDLDKKMQFDFYRLSIRKKKRYSPWIKKTIDEDIELLKIAYGYNNAKAQEMLNIIDPGDIEKIRLFLQKGGIDNSE